MSDSEPTGTGQAQEQQAQPTGTGATQAQQKSGFTRGAKALIGGAALATAGYVAARTFKRFIWPEKGKLKRGVQILLMGGTFYWATHCGSVNAKIGDFYNANIKPTVSEWKTGQGKISTLEQQVNEAYKNQLTSEASYTEAQKELKSIYEQKKTLEEQLKSKDQQNKLLEEKNKGLIMSLDEREARLNEQIRFFEDYKRQQEATGKQAEASYSSQPVLDQSQSSSLEDKTGSAVANYRPDSSIALSGSKMPSIISKNEAKLAKNLSYIIYVDKDENKLSLYQSKGSKLELVKSYKCSTGANPRNKEREGDKATPEGVFLAEYRNFAPVHTGLYGDGIIGLTGKFKGIVLCGADFPDRIRAIRDGRNITNGGVIMQNHDLNDLDARVGRNYSNLAFIIEHSARPFNVSFGK